MSESYLDRLLENSAGSVLRSHVGLGGIVTAEVLALKQTVMRLWRLNYRSLEER
jgi:hypothetical protein